MTWHPDSDPAIATEVCVRFDEIGDGSRTLVTLEHTGWERLREPFEHRLNYAVGWIAVLDGFVAHVGGDADGGDEVWLALTHTAGPDAPADRQVLADPRLRQHFGFLSRSGRSSCQARADVGQLISVDR